MSFKGQHTCGLATRLHKCVLLLPSLAWRPAGADAFAGSRNVVPSSGGVPIGGSRPAWQTAPLYIQGASGALPQHANIHAQLAASASQSLPRAAPAQMQPRAASVPAQPAISLPLQIAGAASCSLYAQTLSIASCVFKSVLTSGLSLDTHPLAAVKAVSCRSLQPAPAATGTRAGGTAEAG